MKLKRIRALFLAAVSCLSLIHILSGGSGTASAALHPAHRRQAGSHSCEPTLIGCSRAASGHADLAV